jgi:putative transposase
VAVPLWPVSDRATQLGGTQLETLRIYENIAVYFLTFSIIDWLPVFISEEPCLIMADSLNFCHREEGLRVNAFVFMPTHLHLIATDVEFDAGRLQQTITDLRKYTGKRLADYCELRIPAVFGRTLRDTQRVDRARQFWQLSRHPEAIQSRPFWQTKVNYLHDNPRRKELVRDATH